MTVSMLPRLIAFLIASGCISAGCQTAPERPEGPPEVTDRPLRVIIDTDANNELDDQHALAYTMLNDEVFDLEGITVNRTYNGGDIEAHMREAERIVRLCGREDDIQVYQGASGSYAEIAPQLGQAGFDGEEAVDFIIERAMADDDRELVLLPVGKLTNVALALAKEPAIVERVRIVWLGSNWPEPGEYNLLNDTTAVNPVIGSGAPFEMALVRYGRYSGTAAVAVTKSEIRDIMPGLGPSVNPPVEGRHGETFHTFGDYSVNLFEHVAEESRALFDMAAVAIVKNPEWAELSEVSGYRLSGEAWEADPAAPTFFVWDLFDTSEILDDFFNTMGR